MNALAIVPPSAVADFSSWLETGKSLLHQRDELDWQLADWIADGRTQFGHQAEFDFLAEQLGIAPKRLKQAERLALAFPSHLRAQDVPVEVHAHIAGLPEAERLTTLQRASREHWDEDDARRVVTQHRQQAAMFEDEDTDARLATELFRVWNRMPVSAREYAWPLLQRARDGGFVAIVEDEVGDDA